MILNFIFNMDIIFGIMSQILFEISLHVLATPIKVSNSYALKKKCDNLRLEQEKTIEKK